MNMSVTQFCSTLCHPMDCSPSGSSVYGILQARIRERLPFSSPGDLPNPGSDSRSPTSHRQILYHPSHQGCPKSYWGGCRQGNIWLILQPPVGLGSFVWFHKALFQPWGHRAMVWGRVLTSHPIGSWVYDTILIWWPKCLLLQQDEEEKHQSIIMMWRDFPGGPGLVVKWLRICPPMQGTWVESLVREPRSHVPRSNRRSPCAATKGIHACCNENPAQPKIFKIIKIKNQ